MAHQVQAARVGLQGLFVLAAELQDIAPTKPAHDLFVAVLGNGQELIAGRDSPLVESLGQLQFNQILVEILVLRVLLEQFLP